ncbi:MAG: hypothetical protein ACJ8LG_16985 [Massilia sp.]
MTSLHIRSLLVLSITALLAACGGNAEQQPAPIQTAALVQTSAAAAPAAGINAPQPDCAPEGCNGLRIIDANAEAWRLEAQRRAAADNGEPTQL